MSITTARTADPAAGIRESAAPESRIREIEMLFERHYRPILNYTMRRLMNMTDAEDVTAETFTRVCARLDSLGTHPRARQAWLYRTATNLVRDQLRRRRRRREVGLDTPGRGRSRDPAAYLANTGTTAHDQMEKLEAYRRVHALMLRLPRKHQDVLSLRFIEEKRLEEIAEILQTRVGTIKWRLHKALKRLGTLAEKDEAIGRVLPGGGNCHG